MAYFFEEEPDDWADEQQNAQQQHAEDGPPEEYQPEPWENDAVAAGGVQSGQPPIAYDLSAPNLRGGCRNCDSFSIDLRWKEAFGVYLCALRASTCHQCRREVELISKGKAKEKYLLTDSDLKKLGSLSKSNPQKKEWSAMKLYLLEQVEEVAEKKHGTYEDIEMRRERQEQSRIQRRIEKRSLETKKVNQVKAKLARIRRQIEAANTAAEADADKPVVTGAAAEVELI